MPSVAIVRSVYKVLIKSVVPQFFFLAILLNVYWIHDVNIIIPLIVLPKEINFHSQNNFTEQDFLVITNTAERIQENFVGVFGLLLM